MTAIPGTVVAAPLSPGDTAATLPTHDAAYGKGGMMQVANAAARTAIPSDRLTVAMHVVQQDDFSEWYWNGTTWVAAGTSPGAITGPLTLSGIIRPTISADTNDWAPTSLSTSATIFANVTGARNLTGLTAGADGRAILLANSGTGTLTLKDESASSTAANRFALANDFILATDTQVMIQYDATAARWRLAGTQPAQLSNFQGNNLYNVRGATTLVTANAYTALDADSGRIVELNDPTGVALTLPSTLPVGWRVRFVQYGAGQVTFGGTATLYNRPSRTKTYGQWAVVDAQVIENAGTAVVVLSGDVDAPVASPAVMIASGASHASGLTPDTPSTAGALKFLREDAAWIDPRLISHSLTQEFETSASGITMSCLVSTTNNGVIGLGTSGAYGKFDWSTFTWTTGTVSGPTAISYTWAIYIPSIDKIWGVSNGGTVHLITPSTMAATDISAATGALFKAAYNPINSLVYGTIAGSATIREMNATTGALTRSYAPSAYALAFIGCHPTTGFVYAQSTTNASSGSSLFAIDPSGFNSVSQTISGPTASAQSANFGAWYPAFMPNNAKVVFGTADTFLNIYDLNAGTQKRMTSRCPAGAFVRYVSSTDKVYINFGTSKFILGRLDPSTPLLAVEDLCTLINAGGGGSAIVDSAYSSADSRLYFLTNASTILRIVP